MSENLEINKSLPDNEVYALLKPQMEALIDTEVPVISNLSNFVSALYHSFDKISWCGFYIAKENSLYLGPFNGKVACTIIKIGKGVCGTSAEKRATVIVEDVDKFPGHIACDGGSKSEIVVPVVTKLGKLFGVLDLDSYEYSSFNNTDKVYLEELLNILVNKISLDNFKI